MRLLRVLFMAAFLSAALLAVGAASLGIAYVKQQSQDLPDHRSLLSWRPHEGSQIQAADGSPLATHASERRDFVSLEEMPPLVVRAFLSAEDRNYWKHSGVDLPAVIRAGLGNLRSRAGGGSHMIGGSTITQQLAKNLLVGNERSLRRKVREAVLARRMDRDLGKEKVLEIYLNDIYLGAGAYGVEAAARAYFGKSMAALSTSEAALIAGMPKAPAAFDPYRNPRRAFERRNYVLRRMAEDDVITVEAAAADSKLPLGVKAGSADEINPAFAFPDELARRSLVASIGADRLLGDGVVAKTTIDPALQVAAHDALRDGIATADRRSGWRGPVARVQLPPNWNDPALSAPAGAEDWQVAVVASADTDARLALRGGSEVILASADMSWAFKPGQRKAAASLLSPGDAVLVSVSEGRAELRQMPEIDGAIVVLHADSGRIAAIDGGFSFSRSEFDRATQAKRQPGSAFKPLVYMAAIEQGYTPDTIILDAPIALDQGNGSLWRPADSEGGGMGPISLARSLAMSRNMSTVRLLYEIGMAPVEDVLKRLGITFPGKLDYSMALGALEMTPLQVASAYAPFANGGLAVQPSLITSVVSRAGDPLFVAKDAEGSRIFTEARAATITGMLRGVVTGGTASKAFSGYRGWAAGKTGTTNEARDAWFAGYAGDLVIVVYIGRDDHKPLPPGAAGGQFAAPIARSFLDRTGAAAPAGPPAWYRGGS